MSTFFTKDINFSIIVPLYNTPPQFLREMIDSVSNQSYRNWELCLADGSDSEHLDVREICEKFAKNDSRILYKKLEKNNGISENTNECIKMATGEYLVMLDHDDVLHKEALQEVFNVIQGENADFIYTDETKFTNDINKSFSPNYKPDFAPDELNAHNYICHLTVYKKSLLEKTGLYSTAHNGSQDHDMVLRLSEHAQHIVHIPKVLYYWRVHSGSVASNVAVKSYAVDAGHLAVCDHIKRLGLNGKVTSIAPFPSLYKIDYEISHPTVNIIIYDTENVDDTNKCIFSLDYHQNWRGVKITVIANSENESKMRKMLWSAPTVWPFELVLTGNNQIDTINEIVKKQDEEYCLFVSAKTFVDTDDYVSEFLKYAQRNDVGIVGGKVSKKDGHIIDFGCALLEDGTVKVLLKNYTRFEDGYEAILRHPRNTTAILGNICMMSKRCFIEAGCFSKEDDMQNAFVKLCIDLRKQSKVNVVLPFVDCTYNADAYALLLRKQEKTDKHDPYYNPNIEKLQIF